MDKKDMDEARKWADEVVAGCGTQIKESAVFASIISPRDTSNPDPIACLQLGMAIMLNKPIIMMVGKEDKLPAALVRAADRIERVDFKNPEDMKRGSAAIAEFAKSVHFDAETETQDAPESLS